MQISIATVFVIIIGSGLGCSQGGGQDYPSVVTPLGTIEGVYNISSEGRLYESYIGVPYASPPTGERRFRVAKPVAPWPGILMAKQFSPWCMQLDQVAFPTIIRAIGSEDCLYLNVYTPTRARRKRTGTAADLLPVILFIHGGAFWFGTGALYGPKYLLNNPVIFVTINYRVGPLGFLSTEDDLIPGNMGLKDQVLAMRWVRDNIRSFGGDPKSVTIVGQSAGGASVHYHYLTNVTAGLFQRGLSVSGTALDCWAQTENSLEKARKLAVIVKCPSDNVRRMVECLKSRPGDAITLAITAFFFWLSNPFTPFGPVVEKGCSDEFKMIDRPPIDSIVTGRVLNKPWITTTVSEEGLYPADEFVGNATLLKQLNDNWEDIAPHLLDYNWTIPDSKKSNISKLIRQHYLGKNSIDDSTVEKIIHMVGDRLYLYNAEEAARLQARVTKSPVRVYYFSYRGAHSLSESATRSNRNFGVSHLDDILYVVDFMFDPTTTQSDREIQKLLINLWVSYASKGEPDVGVQWDELDPAADEFQYLHIAGPTDIRMNASRNFGNKNFWRNIPFRENILPISEKFRTRYHFHY